MLELVFPFDTMGYMTIPYLTLDMVSTDESLIYAPIPFVVGWDQQVYEVIKQKHMGQLEPDLMVIDVTEVKTKWDRKVKYPQPHTRYFSDTIDYLK